MAANPFPQEPGKRGRRSAQWPMGLFTPPKFFGEATLWWGYFLIAMATPGGLWTIFSPALMTWLLVRVSGVAMLERNLLESKPSYLAYVQTTSAFVPWFQKERQPDVR